MATADALQGTQVAPLLQGENSPSLIGLARFSDPLVERHLGLAAIQVFSIGLAFQKKSNRFSMTIAGIGRRTGLSPYQVKKALAALRAAGLEKWLGFQVCLVPFGRCETPQLIPLRTFQRLSTTPDHMRFLAPPATVEWVQKAVTARANWGGKRAGAGRKRKHPLQPPVEIKLVQRDNMRDQVVVPPVPAELGTADGAQVVEAPSAAPDLPLIGGVPTREGGLGLRLGGSFPPEFRFESLRLAGLTASVPKLALDDVRVTVPGPPTIAETDPVKGAGRLLRDYAAVVQAVWPLLEPVWLGRGPVAQRVDFPALVDACVALRSAGVPPVAWLFFSCEAWKSIGKAGRLPVRFAFARGRMQQRMAWCNDWFAGRYPDQGKMPESAHALSRDHARMIDAIERSRPTSAAAVRAVVVQHFPYGEFEKRMRAVRRDADRLHQEMTTMRDQGVILWR